MKTMSLFSSVMIALTFMVLAPSQSWAGQQQTTAKVSGSPFSGVWSGTWAIDHVSLGRVANGTISFRFDTTEKKIGGKILSSTVDYSIVKIANLQSGQLTEVNTPMADVIYFKTPSGSFYQLQLSSSGKVLAGTVTTSSGKSSGPVRLEKQK